MCHSKSSHEQRNTQEDIPHTKYKTPYCTIR
jgi:hypothetical protein